MNRYMDLQNKIAVITGASGGIGSVLVNKLQVLGVEIIPVSIDLTKPAEIDQFISDLKARHDRIDLLVHIAGVGVFKPLPAISKEEWDHSFSLNVTAPFLLTKELLPFLQKSPDSLILAIGSRDGVVGVAQRSLYCATKFALRGLFLSLAEEFKTRPPQILFNYSRQCSHQLCWCLCRRKIAAAKSRQSLFHSRTSRR